DHCRGLSRAVPKARFADIANKGTLQTVPRTINTGMGALFILGALAVLGGDSLRDFAIALLIGIVVGTYSSVFTATPVAIVLEKYAKSPPPRPKDKPKAPVHRTSDSSGAVV